MPSSPIASLKGICVVGVAPIVTTSYRDDSHTVALAASAGAMSLFEMTTQALVEVVCLDVV